MQMQIFSLIFHDRDGYQPITLENKTSFQLFPACKKKAVCGEKTWEKSSGSRWQKRMH